MENKINVAELLRNCPEGMELDCNLFNKPLKYLGLEGSDDEYSIRTVAENGEIFWFTKEGYVYDNMYSKCVIFPKGKNTWEGFKPPCTFKGGDVLISEAGNIVLFSHIDSEGYVYYHCIIPIHGSFRIEKNISTGVGKYYNCVLANEHQKQRIYDKIKSSGYKYNQNTNKLEKLIESKFKNGDVIVGKESTGSYIAIVKEFTNSTSFTTHMFLTSFGTNIAGLNNSNPRLATEYEKQKLFKILEEKGHKWNAETNTLERIIKPKFKVGDQIRSLHGKIYTITNITTKYYTIVEKGSTIKFPVLIEGDKDWELVPNKFDINTLKHFDKVLVRDCNTDKWDIDFFGYYFKGYYYTTGSCSYRQCIPYKGNEHIVGKSVDCAEFYKNWEE